MSNWFKLSIWIGSWVVILQCSSRSFEDANLWDGSMLLIITFQPWNQGKVKQLRHSCIHSLRWWIGRAIVQQWCRGSKSWNRKVVTLLPRLGVQFLGIMRCFGWSKDVINWSQRGSFVDVRMVTDLLYQTSTPDLLPYCTVYYILLYHILSICSFTYNMHLCVYIRLHFLKKSIRPKELWCQAGLLETQHLFQKSQREAWSLVICCWTDDASSSKKPHVIVCRCFQPKIEESRFDSYIVFL